MDLGNPALTNKNMLESNPLTFRFSNQGRISFQSTRSGGGEQLLPLDCMAKIPTEGGLFSRTPVFTRTRLLYYPEAHSPENPGIQHPLEGLHNQDGSPGFHKGHLESRPSQNMTK